MARAVTDRARQLRRTLTLPEILLWQDLRRHQLDGLRFRRRHPIGPFVVDFYCVGAKLAIEVEGAAHDNPQQAAHDARRFAWLAGQGVDVLRFAARDVLDRTKRLEVGATIVSRARGRSTPSTVLRTVPLPRHAGEDTRLP